LQLLQEAQEKMGLLDAGTPTSKEHSDADEKPKSKFHLAASRSWALLLARIYECFPLACPKCFSPMRIIAFIEEPTVIEKVLKHIGEPTQAPEILPARAPPQAEMDFDQSAGADEWPDVDQTAGISDETWD